MTTIKNIARPFGDCLTWIEETSPMFRLCCWADEKEAETGRSIWGHISCVSYSLSQVDVCTILAYAMAVLAASCILAFMVLNAANGYMMVDTLRTWFKALVEAYTHSQRVLERGPETAGYLYVIGLY